MVLVGAVTLPHAGMSFDGEGAASPSESCRRRYAGLPQELQVRNVLEFFTFIT